jgi:hypothetical protein
MSRFARQIRPHVDADLQRARQAVSPFKPMPIPDALQRVISAARR